MARSPRPHDRGGASVAWATAVIVGLVLALIAPAAMANRGATYPDATTQTISYNPTITQVQSVTDTEGQTKNFTYYPDHRVESLTWTGAVNAMPNVAFAYDPNFPHMTSRIDTQGASVLKTAYDYYPVGGLGALRVRTEIQPLASIVYGYDALNRLASRQVSGEGSETFAYDDLGRLLTDTNDLSDLNDPGGAFTFAYNGESGAVYDTNPLNQLKTLTTNGTPATLAWNSVGDLTTDATRTYTWDAENRLASVAAGGQTAQFTYDGLGRRIAIRRLPTGGGTPVTTNYIWCGDTLCQAQNATGGILRAYYAEGELVTGSPAQAWCYAPDNLGSVRRAFGKTASPTYDYDAKAAKRARVAVARKLAILLHKLWRTDTDFNWA